MMIKGLLIVLCALHKNNLVKIPDHFYIKRGLDLHQLLKMKKMQIQLFEEEEESSDEENSPFILNNNVRFYLGGAPKPNYPVHSYDFCFVD